MSEPKAKKNAIIARRRDVAALMRQGVDSVREIAGKLKRPRSTIGRDVQSIREKWLKDTTQDVGYVVARQLIGVMHRRSEIWEAWERSKLDVQSTTEKTTAAGVETTKTRKGQTPNVAYMNALDSLDEREANLFGIGSNAQAAGTAAKDAEAAEMEEQRSLAFVRMSSEELNRRVDVYMMFSKRKVEAWERIKARDAAGTHDPKAREADHKIAFTPAPDWDELTPEEFEAIAKEVLGDAYTPPTPPKQLGE